MPRITPELPPFIAPLVGKLVILAMYGGIGLVLGSILGYTIRRLIYANEYDERRIVKPLVVTAGVFLLAILTCGVLIGLFDAKGFAIVYGIGAVFGAASFARPWWTMRR